MRGPDGLVHIALKKPFSDGTFAERTSAGSREPGSQLNGSDGKTYMVRGSDKKSNVAGPGLPAYNVFSVYANSKELWGILNKHPNGPAALGFVRVKLDPW